MLSSEEKARFERFALPQDAHRYLQAHALLRTTLSRYHDIPPSEWCFRLTPLGRPEIANGGGPPLRFNLTHTEGLVGCVVSLKSDCGIDAERVCERAYVMKIAQRMFNTRDHREMLQLTGESLLRRFYSEWTLREAFVKAKGVGLRYPTRKIAFSTPDNGSVQAKFDHTVSDRAAEWHFRLLRPTPGHIAAIALRQSHAEPKIVQRWTQVSL